MWRARQRLRQLHRAEDGVATVEFSIVFFFFLLPLFVGIAEFGRGLWYHQAVTKGVRDATRYLTRAPLTEPFFNQARTLAMSGLAAWDDPGTIEIAIQNVPNPDIYRGPDPIRIVTVTATVPFNFPLLGAIGLDPGLTLTVADQARHYGE